MKIREKGNPDEVGFSNEFNPNVMGEIIVNFPFYRLADTPDNYEFYVESLDEWVSGERVFDREERLTIVNRYNTHFLEPRTPEDKKRGYEL